MKGTLILVSAAIAASAGMSVGGAAAAPSSPSIASGTCAGLMGAKWKASGGKTGTKYVVGTRGVTCAFVKPWVARLSGLHKANAMIAGGPPGFTCRAAQRMQGEAFYGFTCYNAPANTKLFTVFPQLT